jgi:outer membrane lipoprotein SlyB
LIPRTSNFLVGLPPNAIGVLIGAVIGGLIGGTVGGAIGAIVGAFITRYNRSIFDWAAVR